MTLTLQAADHVAVRIPESSVANDLISLEEEISLNSNPPDRSALSVTCRYDLMLGSIWNKARNQYPKIILETDLDLINKIARSFLTNNQRRSLMTLLRELEALLPEPGAQPPDSARVLTVLKSGLSAQDETDRVLSTALLDSGVLDARIQEGIDARAQAYIAQNANKLSAEIDQKIAEQQGQLSRLTKEQEGLQDELDRQRRHVKREIEEAWSGHQAKCQQEEKRIEDTRKDVARLQQEVAGRLENVLTRFAVGKDELINDFLALSPLLSAGREPGLIAQSQGQAPTLQLAETVPPFEIPPFVQNTQRQSDQSSLNELEFFERFSNHTQNCRTELGKRT